MDAEMWPEEEFGGISDEQFWDDLASDKPLTTTARTAAPESGPVQPQPRQRPSEQRPGEQRPGELRLPGRPAGAGATQGFPPVAGPPSGPQPVHQTGPQPVQATTQAFPASPSQSGQGTTQAYQLSAIQASQATGPQPIRAAAPAAPAAPRRQQYQPPQPAPARSATRPPSAQPQLTQPQMAQPQAAQSQMAQPQMAQPQARPASLPAAAPQSGASTGRGRHSSGEDPLTSAAYSLRSGGSVDGRSYQASRRAREMSRDQYEAAISQETQTFSMPDSEPAYPGTTPPYGYDTPAAYQPGASVSPRPARRDDHGGTGGYPYQYGQPGQAMPATQTPAYGESYGTDGYGPEDNGWGSGARDGWGSGAQDGWGSGARDGWGSGARDYGRPPVNGARNDQGQHGAGRERAAYQSGHPGPYDPRGTDRR